VLALALFLALALGRGVLGAAAVPVQGALALALLGSILAHPQVVARVRLTRNTSLLETPNVNALYHSTIGKVHILPLQGNGMGEHRQFQTLRLACGRKFASIWRNILLPKKRQRNANR
jgi:hypothetical protein